MAIRILLLFFIFTHQLTGQNHGSISGKVFSQNEPISFVSISIDSLKIATSSDENGEFYLDKIPFGKHQLHIHLMGFQDQTISFEVSKNQRHKKLNISLEESAVELNQVVVTGTKTVKKQTDSPVIVNVISSKSLQNFQACNLAEGLKFQPGLRVEVDCQTCNYTQLRMNGLAGGYSQILINGRPIFSPLTGLYGLEQLPTNMIERIEVVRGGGSSLYGSSAIGGTVNVLTKIPKQNSFEIDYNYQNISGQTGDHLLNANATIAPKNSKISGAVFAHFRRRGWYDHNGDNFSEIPEIENNSLGGSLFYSPSKNQKVELSISHLYEYRYGGEMVEKPAYLAQQSEERKSHVTLGSLDYQLNFNDDKSSFITYLAWQNTNRNHYTGIMPDDSVDVFQHSENPPYGDSKVQTVNAGTQFNHTWADFFLGENILTLGAEYVWDDVLDEIEAYQYLIDQTTRDLGIFAQTDWQILPKLSLLAGLRMDAHNLVDKLIFSPRASLLYQPKKFTQIRLSYGTGFRSPQAFDADLHIAFAGGGISRVSLSPNLKPETSESWSASLNFDKPTAKYIFGFTVEGFYTQLKDAFYLQHIGNDAFGERFEKQNGAGATVLGATVEGRINYNQKIQVETGFTLQKSRYAEPVQYIENTAATRDFARTPNQYGFATLTATPIKNWEMNLNYVFTGTMLVPHFAGAPNQKTDEIYNSPNFHEFNVKIEHTVSLKKIKPQLRIYAGVKNLFNSYQNDFDIGKNRDSNYIYGTAQPRTFFVGLSIFGAQF